jgi:SAM-dependent methyltransferase
MTHDEMVALIRAGVRDSGGPWADFGAGSGSFTRALRALLDDSAALYAVDRDARALRTLAKTPGLARTQIIHADFTQPLALPPLAGLLIANALHWINDQAALMTLLAGYLRPGGALLLVEYDVRQPRGYIPCPVPYPRFARLAADAGLVDAQRVGERRSPSSGVTMYAAMAVRPGPGA